MSKFTKAIDKFGLFLKLNKLNLEILNFLADSLSIEEMEDKNKLIKEISKQFEKMKKEDSIKFEKLIDEQIYENCTPNTKEKKGFDKIEISPVKKRNYYEYSQNKKNEDKDKINKKNNNKKLDSIKLFDYDKFLNPGEKYYYVDNENNEWEFREKKGSNIKFYFKCSTEKCLGYGMILKNDKEKKFTITKEHNIPYLLHTYCNINIKNEKFNNIEFSQNDWDNEIFRTKFINWYFEKNNQSIESDCLAFIKVKFENKIIINEDLLKNEIKKGKIYINMKNRAKESILTQLLNMKDDNNEVICTPYKYESINNKNKDKINSTLFIIMNKIMISNIKNNNIQQFFTDITYHCIPPTIRKYKLIVLSGFNLRDKKVHICSYGLIPDEKYVTINKYFDILKNVYKFYPKLINTDFSKSLSKAIKNNFSDCLIIKCYFHFSQAIWKKVKQLGYTEKDILNNTIELLSNIKVMCFMDPKKLKKFYSLITDEYGEKYESFFKYFEKQWINKKKLGKYTPIWNYFINLNKIEFDEKFLFLTNNISENINHLLNSFFNKKYPVFKEWRNSLLSVVNLFENKADELHRKNFSSKLMFYYIKIVNINSKSLKLLNKKEIEDIKILEENYRNILSATSISRLLLSDENIKLSMIKNEDDINIYEESSEDMENEEDCNEINEIEKNLDLLNIEDNEMDFHLKQIIKDIDFEKSMKEINDEISKK